MKKAVVIALLLAATSVVAQQPQSQQPTRSSGGLKPRAEAPASAVPASMPEAAANAPQAAPTNSMYSKTNCSGFVSSEPISDKMIVIGGEDSPQQSYYAGNETVFLTGEGLSVGAQYRIVRRIQDPNKTESSRDATKLVHAYGDQWGDIGIVRVHDLVNGTAVAQIDFSCQPVLPGDIAVPFVERPVVTVDKTRKVKEWGVAEPQVHGKIIQSFEFDNHIGTGERVYVSIGGDKVKPGDYLRVSRSYERNRQPAIDRISEEASVTDSSADRMPKVHDTTFGTKPHVLDKMPPHGIGEVIVLWTTNNTAVGMVTLASEDIKIGDDVGVVENSR